MPPDYVLDRSYPECDTDRSDYRKLYDKFFIYYKKENPSISTGIGLYGKPEKTSVYDEATGTYTVSYTVEYKINVGAPVVSCLLYTSDAADE